VNRADFIPNTIWVDREDGWMVPVRRDEDPERWLSLVDSDDPIVTQVDDGELEDGKGVIATSSSSALVVMQKMFVISSSVVDQSSDLGVRVEGGVADADARDPASSRACRDASEVRWRAGTGGDGARPVASRSRSTSARRSASRA
jgi:hypothetical protein